jgi:hypothetical protein
VTALVQSLLRLYHGVYWFFASHITLKLDFKLFYHFLIGFLLFFAFAFDPRILFPGKLGNFRYVVVGDGRIPRVYLLRTEPLTEIVSPRITCLLAY